MKRTLRTFQVALSLLTFVAVNDAFAQCPVAEVISGLRMPLGITLSNRNNLIVSETGTRQLHSGRISIVDPDGTQRTLLDGLPADINDVNEPSGPAGVFMRGQTLYVAIGIGNTILPGPFPGTATANPNPSSPIFSSVLAIHFSANAEKITTGFLLTPADHLALANGEQVTLSNGGGDKITTQLVANFADFTPNPTPTYPANVRGSNPFDLVAVGNRLYVTDGGQNAVWKVDLSTGSFSKLVTFPNIPNPLFNPTPPPPSLGGPFVEAVPTGIQEHKGRLFVTLFRGFPFPAGASVVERIDPATGNHVPFITELKTAIDVLPLTDRGTTSYLVLQHASGPVLSGPGILSQFDSTGSSSTTIASCLMRPTSMTRDDKTGAIYITELQNGRVVVIE